MPVITIKKNNTYTVDDLFQWDTNRILEIYGLNFSSLPEIHFANSRTVKAIVKQAEEIENGGFRVEIPNSFLETATPIRVYLCDHEGEEFISRFSFSINVKARPKPEDYFAEDDEKIYSYNALENLVRTTASELKTENAQYRNEMDSNFSEAMEELKNTPAANADAVDGFHAEDFELIAKPGKTVFNPDGSITTDYDDGSKETTVFNADGSITTTRNTLELGVKTETTRFNADGSITVTAN